jgi:hypothetical protein
VSHTASDDPSVILDPATRRFYLKALEILDQSKIRYVVGGAYAMAAHAGIVRHTKDLDVFMKPQDVERTFAVFEQHGYPSELTHPHWVGKIYNKPGADSADAFVDVIYSGGNGLTRVDDEWLDHATIGDVVGRKAPLSPAEEIIWSKSFVQERDRFDGADVAHLLLARGAELDWPRLFKRFEGHERVLLGHLVMFGYIFPCQKHCVPQHVVDTVIDKLRNEPPQDRNLCRGTNLSWSQYLVDINGRGYTDARLAPHGHLSPEQIATWTKARK